MRYLIAIILPPLAVLLCGKIFQFFLSILLTLCFWVPGIIHALFVVSSTKADERNERLIQALNARPHPGPQQGQRQAIRDRRLNP